MRTKLLAAMALTLTGCAATVPPSPSVGQADGLTRAALGQTVGVGGPKVTPLALLEDSRCPANVRCVWAGRVRLSVRVDLGSGSQVRELTLGAPVPVADGTLELVEVLPEKVAGTIAPQDYRFGFRFMGGL
ncbi:hypothetical protein HNO88_002328 [Novosphingobium chloroacetimidivorans]|uniref:Lipoprotein n=1 Tax=Novosphingobium chloroacetimidivorans TaxID=1428314 RepID=A0A7W7KA23_9SPHN|nr:hypothetical protein [Novosphingobium chloroacetimidivorans]MBB4859002.1 hypothetical protein [Novosphingobium chloroacetimidivorans]